MRKLSSPVEVATTLSLTNNQYYTCGGRQRFTQGRLLLRVEARHRLSAQSRDELHPGNFIVLGFNHVQLRTEYFRLYLLGSKHRVFRIPQVASAALSSVISGTWSGSRCMPFVCRKLRTLTPQSLQTNVHLGPYNIQSITPFIWGWQFLDSNSSCYKI